jgi:hypothetical protein
MKVPANSGMESRQNAEPQLHVEDAHIINANRPAGPEAQAYTNVDQGAIDEYQEQGYDPSMMIGEEETAEELSDMYGSETPARLFYHLTQNSMRYYDSDFAPPLSRAQDVNVPTRAMEQLHMEEKKVPAGSDSAWVSHAVNVQAVDEQSGSAWVSHAVNVQAVDEQSDSAWVSHAVNVQAVDEQSDSAWVSHAVNVQADDGQPVGPMAEFQIAEAMMSKADDFETAAEREQRKRREQ